MACRAAPLRRSHPRHRGRRLGRGRIVPLKPPPPGRGLGQAHCGRTGMGAENVTLKIDANLERPLLLAYTHDWFAYARSRSRLPRPEGRSTEPDSSLLI